MRPTHAIAFLATLGATLGAAHAKTVVVPDDAPTLTLALNPAAGFTDPGDTIELTDAASYFDSYEVVIPDLTIIGRAGQTITINPFSTGPCFTTNLSSAGAVRLENLTLINGRAEAALGYTNEGGGIRNINATLGLLEVIDCTVQDCSAAFSGGGIYATGVDMLIEGSTFQDNSGDNGLAGAIRCSAADITVRDSTFIGNDAISASDTGTGGALAVATDGATLLVEGCHFEDNEAGTVGGAIYTTGNSASVTLRDTTFFANLAVLTNSADAGGVMVIDANSLLIERCVFEENRCDGQGGALRTQDVPGTIVDSRFVGNMASEAAGVLMLTGSDIDFYNCVFEANDATLAGAGAGNAGAAQSNSGSSALFVNCLFYGNKAVSGGAVSVNFSVSASAAAFDNCTFAANEATSSGGAVAEIGSATTSLENCVVWGNTPQLNPIVGSVTVRYSDIEGGFTGAGNIDLDPMFAAPGSDDYTLAPGSPAIDAGDNAPYLASAGPYADLAGNLRALDDPATPDTGLALIGPVIDMGCYEFGSLSAPPACIGDLDANGRTDVIDFSIWVIDFGCEAP